MELEDQRALVGQPLGARGQQAANEGAQAVVLLPAGGAAVEMGRGLGIAASTSSPASSSST